MSDEPQLKLVVDGVDFGEGPRWHDGRLWYCDFYQRAIYTVTEDGHRHAVYGDLPDQTSGLGWLPDGRLLAVSMTNKQVLRDDGNGFVVHADLSDLATGYCNDMVVDRHGNAYVGNFGFDLFAGEEPRGADLVLVRENGTTQVVASGLRFANGSVITPDGSTLIVGESFGAGYEAFAIDADGTLSNRRRWADVPGMAPDGCTLDAELGIWFADALGSQLVRVVEGGQVTHRIPTPQPVFACALGGELGQTLYALCAPGSQPDEVRGKAAGAIYSVWVDVPHAGWP
ncbi:MAG: SMP-30/gluconolactonase/LRE family protein [Ilumatobacteraceae bacterium]